jgi:hypothetical protein
MAKAKHIAGIDCQGAAAEAIRLVLVTRFDEMCALRDHALDWTDPEGVHDMRVSSRRLRGALRDFKPYLHKTGLAVALKQIRDVADALGAVRDQDVAIMGLQKLAAGAPAEAAAMLDQLVRAREAVRKQARRDLRQSVLAAGAAEATPERFRNHHGFRYGQCKTAEAPIKECSSQVRGYLSKCGARHNHGTVERSREVE